METVLVNKETLQKLLDYIGPDEARDYEECSANEWSQAELANHAYALITELQDCINTQ
jgi:hypothetical protein